MQQVKRLPSPGAIARVRQRTYLIEEVIEGASVSDSTLVRMSCVDDDNQGVPLEVLWENEIDREVLTGEAWESVAKKGFDNPKVFGAYLNTLRWNCVTSTDPKLFQSPFRAGIKLEAYQLEPLRKALLLPRVNLFIADDVGLGKTIEAGLIARELLLRKKVREIVVSCPPSMLYQWQEELETRFGLTFEIIDKEYMKRIRRERGFSVNPWTTHSRFLISQRLLIDEAYTGPLRDWLGTFRSGSLLILDEAHHAAPASGQKYAIDSQLTRAVRDLAPRFEHRLFLSATPHNGHSNSFSALLEILDPQRFCRGVPVPEKHRDEVVVRRLKEDIREIRGGFPKRHVVQIDIDGLPKDAPELALSSLLNQYADIREERLKGESKRTQASAGLLITGLQQRLLSSIEAFAKTLRVHRKTVGSSQLALVSSQTTDNCQLKSIPDNRQLITDNFLSPIDADDDRATLSEEELEADDESQIERLSLLSLGPIKDASRVELIKQEINILDRMSEIAEDARHKADGRIREMVRWMKENMCPNLGSTDAAWNDTRIIIFTEYDDTKRYLRDQLESVIAKSDRAAERILIYHGPTPPVKREEIKKAFNTAPSKQPVRILIATDAAREGLNLQAHCAHLFHFDIPWNPSRMEQRNGRIDRKLQPKLDVYCHYFVYKQRPEDRILQVLVKKTETIKQELGSLSQVIDSKLTKSLGKGLRHRDLAAIEFDIQSADLDVEQKQSILSELESGRDRQLKLREQIERLSTLLGESEKTIAFDVDNFRSAISCSLEMVGGEPLAEVSSDESGTQRFVFPAMDQRKGADPTWADTMDSLRGRRPREKRLWDWRRESPVLPVVFKDTGRVDDSVVHLHLEQRAVQRLLGRFMAQGFVHHDLARACLAQTSDAVPRVILLGRLCLYGPSAARLHEELVPITARWSDPATRKSAIAPYARDAETKTLFMLDESLLKAGSMVVSPESQQLLCQSAVRDIEELLPHLQQRGNEYAADANRKLSQRAEAESSTMRTILETQRKHIIESIKKHEKINPNQLKFDFADREDELHQLESNKRYWSKRLDMLQGELQSEPDRVRSLYAVQAQRIEPVGLVYLWPVTR